jgi:ABC-type uncharacterized transport system ATPase component
VVGEKVVQEQQIAGPESDSHLIQEPSTPIHEDDFINIVGHQHGHSTLLEVIKHKYKDNIFFAKV